MGESGLTYKFVRSEASSMDTNVAQIDDDAYKINGNKRWIGSANRDITLVWTKNIQIKKVLDYITDKGTPRFTYQVIKNKGEMRTVQSFDITLENAISTKNTKLPLAKDF